MVKREQLARHDIDAELARLDGWTLSTNAASITKRFRFKSFGQAFAFMTRVAMLAEKLDHHPEWSNVYATVDVKLTTHDAGGLTALDFQMAERMDKFAAG